MENGEKRGSRSQSHRSKLLVGLLVSLSPAPHHHSTSHLLFESDSKSFSVWLHSVPGAGVGPEAWLLAMAEGNTGHGDSGVGNTECLGPATGGSAVCVCNSLVNLKLD